jgi:hypothetical protein
MSLSSRKHAFPVQAVLATAGLVAALCLGACGRSSNITNPAVDVTRSGSLEFAKGGNGNAHKVPPATPSLSSPADGASAVAANTMLVWNAASGASSYRVQISTNATFSGMTMDKSGIAATSVAATGLLPNTNYFWRVSAKSPGASSAFSAPFSFSTGAGAPPPPQVSTDPCASLNGLGGSVLAVAQDIPQFRVDRLRIELTGDVTAGTILTMGPCTEGNSPADQFISGTGSVTLSGSGASVAGGALTFGALLAPVPAEAGVVLATDAAGNVLEIIWPALAGLPPGPPILRLQLATFSGQVQQGTQLDATMTFTARAPDGTTATFTATGTNMVVPALK